MVQFLVTCLIVILTATPVSAQWRDILQGLGLGGQGGLSEAKIASGLKEALEIGAANAVRLTGRRDGYFLNDAIKILMPEKLKSLEKGLRLVGYGPPVDAFVMSMNRAAEDAAPLAKEIFLGAIGEMTFDDAKRILSGSDTAATDYFREKTSGKLRDAFRPVVQSTMNKTGVTRQYRELVGRYDKIPMARQASFDVDDYVLTRSLDGLFFTLGQEEKKIRTDPAARVTGRLKEVFGG